MNIEYYTEIPLIYRRVQLLPDDIEEIRGLINPYYRNVLSRDPDGTWTIPWGPGSTEAEDGDWMIVSPEGTGISDSFLSRYQEVGSADVEYVVN